jgi:hypothetical protein
MAKRIKIKPCIKCGNKDIKIYNCGYSTFNVSWGECSCGHKVEIKNCNWDITDNEIIKRWNKGNNPTLLRKDYTDKISVLQSDLDKLPLPKSKKTGIKPCPFCGGEGIVEERHIKVTNDPDYSVDCVTSFCIMRLGSVAVFSKESEAIQAWNRRFVLEVPVKNISEPETTEEKLFEHRTEILQHEIGYNVFDKFSEDKFNGEIDEVSIEHIEKLIEAGFCSGELHIPIPNKPYKDPLRGWWAIII